MKKILFPIEFSEYANEPFKYAAELAYFFKSNLEILHVIYNPQLALQSKSDLDQINLKVWDRMREFVKKNLPEAYQNIKINYVTRVGTTSEVILDYALEENVELILMGATGKNKAFNALFGTTTLEVLEKADCPVLMVPAGIECKGIDNLVFTTNFEFKDFGAINYLKKWARTLSAPIHCLHLIEDREKEMSAITRMSILSETYKRHKNIHFDMRHGDFPEEIERFAKSKRADIVAMIAHKQNYFSRLIMEKNVVKGIAKRIQIPLLIIKENAYEIDNDLLSWAGLLNTFA
jgi:nucleotide-binding universal stress UspA family protein